MEAKARAAKNREQFPETARFLDEMRAVFGADVKLEYAHEGGRELGTCDLPGVAVPLNKMVLSMPAIPANKKGRR